MNGRVTIKGRKRLAMLHLLIGCLFLPFGAAALMLSAASLAQENWIAGAFSGVFALPAFLLILGHITMAYRAGHPDYPMIMMSDTEFYDARIMAHPIPWHRLRFETNYKTGQSYVFPVGRYKKHMHNRLSDRTRRLLERMLGQKGYLVRAEWTGLSEDQLARELRFYTTPVGNYRGQNTRAPRRTLV